MKSYYLQNEKFNEEVHYLWLSHFYKDNAKTIASSEEDVDKMTFNLEDELFPTVNVNGDTVKEEVNVSNEVVEAACGAKRKTPEKPTEKKVSFVLFLW